MFLPNVFLILISEDTNRTYGHKRSDPKKKCSYHYHQQGRQGIGNRSHCWVGHFLHFLLLSNTKNVAWQVFFLLVPLWKNILITFFNNDIHASKDPGISFCLVSYPNPDIPLFSIFLKYQLSTTNGTICKCKRISLATHFTFHMRKWIAIM